MYAVSRKVPTFELFIRCENCLRESLMVVEVPDVDDAPRDADQLADSNFLANLRFTCRHCRGNIGCVFGVAQGG